MTQNTARRTRPQSSRGPSQARRQRDAGQKPGRRPRQYTADRKVLSDGLEASRSPHDGVWRIWGTRSPAQLGFEEDFGNIQVPVILGAAEKLGDAHRMARRAGRSKR